MSDNKNFSVQAKEFSASKRFPKLTKDDAKFIADWWHQLYNAGSKELYRYREIMELNEVSGEVGNIEFFLTCRKIAYPQKGELMEFGKISFKHNPDSLLFNPDFAKEYMELLKKQNKDLIHYDGDKNNKELMDLIDKYRNKNFSRVTLKDNEFPKPCKLKDVFDNVIFPELSKNQKLKITKVYDLGENYNVLLDTGDDKYGLFFDSYASSFSTTLKGQYFDPRSATPFFGLYKYCKKPKSNEDYDIYMNEPTNSIKWLDMHDNLLDNSIIDKAVKYFRSHSSVDKLR